MKNNWRDFKELFKNIDFLKLWIAQVLSLIGDYIYSVNLYIWIYKLTGSALALSSSIFFQTVPRLIMAPIAGIIIDRFNRKKILILSDILRGIIICLFIFVKSKEQLLLVYLVVIINAVISRIAIPARSTILPIILEKDKLIKANSLYNFTESATLIVGPILGGILSILNFNIIVFINTVSFFLSALLINNIGISNDVVSTKTLNEKSGSFWSELGYVKKLFKKNPLFMGLLSVTVLSALGQGGINILYYPFLLDVVKVSNTQFGLTLSFFGLGSIIGSMLTGFYADISKARWVIGGGVLVSGISVILYNTFPNLYMVIFTTLIEGIAIAGVFILIPSIVQTYFKKGNQGKVFGLLDAFESGSMLFSMGLSGIIVSLFGIRVVLYVLAGLFLFAGIIGTILLKPEQEFFDEGEVMNFDCL
ncbi:hypothetical protein BBF96_00425 [Anoxybacter fermentans]|uniref:Major facilitator superfamily (MFS) profile domain-containing protein n=1 Tax=Anoxybacter fermentans TaxID=1323375 RepID=A0A3Q9HNE7_9FIRM|nr:MFS transporter [Anoxybacter fermentans]AZR72002.1 hypothetical protein BBF96_00425 [Anoxybacter fermentans]